MRSLLLSPRWLIRHAVAITLIAACLRLGWWQWDRARSIDGTAQNLGYSLQWPAFAIFVGYFWYRMLTLELHPTETTADRTDSRGEASPRDSQARPTVAVRRRYTPPASDTAPPNPDELSEPSEPADDQLAAYNAYLTSLAGHSRSDRDQLRRTTP